MLWKLTLWIFLGSASLAVASDSFPLTFHASFDGKLDATARGSGVPLEVTGPVAYRPGKVGKALLCGDGGASLTYRSDKNLRAASGTLEMWVCPLDWTGTEDEFHVFFEAQNPGWLVFYRYYQGGLLTLMGTDGEHYRAAAGPPFQWKPGEWHHVAGVWRAKRLEVYVDGKRVASQESPVIPERLADTFVVGDRPWHVTRQRQTLIDEVKLYAAPLDETGIANAARGEPVSYQPQMLLDTRVDPDRDQMQVTCDVSGFVSDSNDGYGIDVTINEREGGEPLARSTVSKLERDLGSCELSLQSLPAGDYHVQAQLKDRTGRTLTQAAQPLHNPGPPVWSGNQLGLSDTIVSPWEPLEAAAATVHVGHWGPRYTWGTLLKQVQVAEAELLAQDVRLEAVIDGQTQVLTGDACNLQVESATRATWNGTAEVAGLKAAIQHTVEFDGFTWTDLTLEPIQPVTVEELRLTWTMPASAATLLHADAQRWSENPAGRLPASGWSSPRVPFFWLGNETRGLCWYTESVRDWRPVQDPLAIQVQPDGSQVRVTIRLMAERTTITRKMEYGFGMMATPARPPRENTRRWRMAPAVRSTFEIIWPNDCMKWYGYPEPIDAEQFRERVRTAHKQNVQIVPYVNLNFMSAGAPEWQYYGARWADPARVVTPSDVAAMGHASMGTCPANQDWQDFILYRINEMIDQYEIDGIYIDCWSPYACRAGKCGVQDEEGQIHATWPIRSYRQILRRVSTLFQEKRPNPLVMVHMSSEVVIPMLTFTDTILDGEQFGGAHLADDYLELLPPDKFRAEFLGRNWGPVAFFLPEFRGEASDRGTPSLAAYLLLHDVQPWPIWSDVAAWNRLYDALDARGFVDSTFQPYWQDSGVHAEPSVLVSSYVGPKGAILAVMNTGDAVDAKLELQLQRLGLSRIGSAVDALTDTAFTTDGRSVVIPLQRHQGRVIVVGQ